MTYDDLVSNDYPVWNLERIYQGFSDQKFADDVQELVQQSHQLLEEIGQPIPQQKDEQLVFCEKIIDSLVRLNDIEETLFSYTYMVYSSNTSNEEALKKINFLEKEFLILKRLWVRFQKLLLKPEFKWQDLINLSPKLRQKQFHLEQFEVLAKHAMSEEMEDLTNDLNRSGAEAWGRLQETITSHLQTTWDESTGEKKTLVELRQLAADANRDVRKKAYELELRLLKNYEIPLAAALNGVKGTTVTVNQRRGWKDTLDKSAFQSRISSQALETLIQVLNDSLPVFQRYLRLKARALNISVCAFFDLFAPVGESQGNISWNEAKDFILTQFSGFSERLSNLAKTAFDEQWIHAKPMAGKVGGAYCISLPLRGESRILCNFDGSFGEIKTLAHELGHAYHFEVLKKASSWDRAYPMTLAETASTFAETLVFEAAYQVAPPKQALNLLENQLQDITQVCVDILSRFKFEYEVLSRRAESELSPSELCELMSDAQKATYGHGLDLNYLHPYMWAVKGHYYSHDLAFYNYPYAFGQLLSLTLYERFKEHGRKFSQVYDEFLASTGKMSCDDAVAILGEDIKNPHFWQSGIKMVDRLIDEFEKRLA
jgi:pepF/M3 family oligoendopeptidase